MITSFYNRMDESKVLKVDALKNGVMGTKTGAFCYINMDLMKDFCVEHRDCCGY